jgi:hypothetical protein
MSLYAEAVIIRPWGSLKISGVITDKIMEQMFSFFSSTFQEDTETELVIVRD